MWTTLFSTLFSALFGALTDAFTNWQTQLRAEQTLRDAGAQAAIATTTTVIGAIADDQAKVNSTPRDVQSVIDELRPDDKPA